MPKLRKKDLLKMVESKTYSTLLFFRIKPTEGRNTDTSLHLFQNLERVASISSMFTAVWTQKRKSGVSLLYVISPGEKTGLFVFKCLHKKLFIQCYLFMDVLNIPLKQDLLKQIIYSNKYCHIHVKVFLKLILIWTFHLKKFIPFYIKSRMNIRFEI